MTTDGTTDGADVKTERQAAFLPAAMAQQAETIGVQGASRDGPSPSPPGSATCAAVRRPDA